MTKKSVLSVYKPSGTRIKVDNRTSQEQSQTWFEKHPDRPFYKKLFHKVDISEPTEIILMVVTRDKLKVAIQNALEVSPDEALDMADRVLRYFGYENVIVDNAIDSEDRKLFYRLHDAALLNSNVDSEILPSGKSWRIFYWEIDAREVERNLKKERKGKEVPYENLPDEAWWSPKAAEAE